MVTRAALTRKLLVRVQYPVPTKALRSAIVYQSFGQPECRLESSHHLKSGEQTCRTCLWRSSTLARFTINLNQNRNIIWGIRRMVQPRYRLVLPKSVTAIFSLHKEHVYWRFESSVPHHMPSWWNWQTRQIQALVSLTQGFESPVRHHLILYGKQGYNYGKGN